MYNEKRSFDSDNVDTISFKVPQDKIGIIIGSGGRTIKKIMAETDTKIDIDDDGTVKVSSRNAGETKAKEAESWIKRLVENSNTRS